MTEAELVFTHILKCDRTALYLKRGRTLDRSESGRISAVLQRRMSGEPLAYILGRQEFMGFDFEIDPAVLIPRMETEILVETAVRYGARVVEHQSTGAPEHQGIGLRILDIGTGSGNIAVSLARMLPEVRIDALDISEEALAVARKNARLNNVEDKISFIHSDFFNFSHELRATSYELIVSNPPYIPSAEITRLQPEVQHEPRIALDGGIDGLDFYRRIIADAPAYLKDGGVLLMEMGFGQRPAVEEMVRESDVFEIEEIVKDYSGIERVVVARISHRS
jgi:release factor glutamine methyltransferase